MFDNSPTPKAKEIIPESKEFVYKFLNRNIGFSHAHNLLLSESTYNSKYVLILNPDVYFNLGTVERIIDFMEEDKEVGLLLPRVLNPDGTEQPLYKQLPKPKDLIMRRFLPNCLRPFFQKGLSDYSMNWADPSRTFEAPYLSGCFMFMRSSAFKKVGGFDSRFFLYCEDIDLSRRITRDFKTVYFSQAYIFHYFNRASYRSLRYSCLHLISAIKYFNKYGWLIDTERDLINDKVRVAYKNIESNE